MATGLQPAGIATIRLAHIDGASFTSILQLARMHLTVAWTDTPISGLVSSALRFYATYRCLYIPSAGAAFPPLEHYRSSLTPTPILPVISVGLSVRQFPA